MAEKVMTDSQHRVLVNYVREVADKMGLRDWQFFIEKDYLVREPDRLAMTSVWGDSKTATIEFGESFFSTGPAMQREVVVHECTHWHLDAAWRLVSAVVKEHMAPAAVDVMRTAYEQQMELAVDGIASSWARSFPLINWKSTAKLYTEAQREQTIQPTHID